MSSLRHIPLGHAIPDLPHAVSVSLPTLADLIGYETKDPAIIRQIPTGYPRFVLHPFVRTLTAEFARRQGLHGQSVWLTATMALARQLCAWMGPEARVVAEGELQGVSFPPAPERNGRAKAFLQHCGGFVSSRHAEDLLAAAGLVPVSLAAANAPRDPLNVVKRCLAPAFDGASGEDLFVAANGMNAIHSAFAASNAIQAPRGRTVWVQLGWLYLDTIAILQKLTANPAVDCVVVPSVHDLAGLRAALDARRGRVAGIITEVPTNPLVQSCDLTALGELARAHGAHLLVDTSIASPWNVRVLPEADLALASLTKYAAIEGDLLAGAVAVNPTGNDAAALRAELEARVAPLYKGDLARLAEELSGIETSLAQINRSTMRVAEFLGSRRDVRRVHWALAGDSASTYRRLARAGDAVGGMISFELEPGAFGRVYDRARLAKGPSFGMRQTLLCPFLYLAHYELVSTKEGRALLANHGINPELLRLSVGLEPPEMIIEALREALDF